MTPADFEIYKKLLMEKSGLVITPDKAYLIDSRLTPVAKKWGHENLASLTVELKGTSSPDLVKDIVEAMTTNETSFYRDGRPFETLKGTVIPYLLQNRSNTRRIKTWCAAASSGQEPYTIAMEFKEHPTINSWDTPIYGTDISTEIIDQAKQGIYSQFEVQRGLPIQMLMKYFEQNDEKWLIKDEIKNMVKYEYFNLLDNMAGIGKYDIIFCRNVLIYFDEETKRDVLERMVNNLEDDGFLFLGGAETVLGITESFKPIPEKRGLYAKPHSVHIAGDTKPEAPASGTGTGNDTGTPAPTIGSQTAL